MAQQGQAAAPPPTQKTHVDNAKQETKTEKSGQSAGQSPDTSDPNDPLFGVPPLPKGEVSLLGGTVQKIDRVHNRLTVKAFGDGAKKVTVAFDERTHIFRDGVETTERGIRPGDRTYVDTMLDGPRLFARNIRVVTNLKPTDAQGQIMSYDARTGLMTMRDDLSAAPVSFRVTQATKVTGGGGQGAMDLVPGSLVSVRFSPDQRLGEAAREVQILAVPGNKFTFAGKVRYLDMSRRTMAVENLTDNKTYEFQFDPGVVNNNVTVGSDVTVSALFSGKGYTAQNVAVNQAKE